VFADEKAKVALASAGCPLASRLKRVGKSMRVASLAPEAFTIL
jgi:hypothetical protein